MRMPITFVGSNISFNNSLFLGLLTHLLKSRKVIIDTGLASINIFFA